MLSRLSPRWRAVSMVIVLGPLLISVVVRTLGWAVLLGNEGVINKLLLALGWSTEPMRMMFTFTGVVVALVHVLVPFMVLAVWASLQKLDAATEQAAESLGADLPTVLRAHRVPAGDPGRALGRADRVRARGQRLRHAGNHRRAATEGGGDDDLRRIPRQPELAAGRGAGGGAGG